MSIKGKAPVYDIRDSLPSNGSRRGTPPSPAPSAEDDSAAVQKYARILQEILTQVERRLLSLIVQGCSMEDLCTVLDTDPDAVRQTWVLLRRKIQWALDQGCAPSSLKRRFLRILSGPWFLFAFG